MLLKLAFLNLFRNMRRTLSTGVAICIGFVGLNLLGAYIFRVKKALDTTAVYSALNGHLKIYKKDSLTGFSVNPKKYIITEKEIIDIENVLRNGLADKLDYIGKNLNGSALISNGNLSHPVLFYSFEPEIYAKSITQPAMYEWAKDWVLPSQFENVKLFKENNEVVSLTPKIADILSLKYPLTQNESLQLAGRTFDGDLNAVNVELGAEHTTGMQFLEDSLILVPLKKIQELFIETGVESISVYLKSYENLNEHKVLIAKWLTEININADVFLYYDEKINSIYLGTIGFLIVMGSFFVFLIGTAVSLSIVNSLTMGIIERTREIGTLLAVGFKRKDVKQLFVLEGLILSLASIIVGIGISFIIAFFINKLNIRFTPPGLSNAVQFKLAWNGAIAGAISLFTLVLTYFSSLVVMSNKSKTKLINLIGDYGA